MLQPEDEKEVQVLQQDQERINLFSKLTSKIVLLEEEFSKLKEEKEYVDELLDELELADEDEPVNLKIGDSFVEMPLSDAQDRLQKEQAVLADKVKASGELIDSTNSKMTELKGALYAKFGNTIHLEKD
ncbi:hypothetical protein DSO57_1002925 [Entomophthora muscae]|uniref:Uncharacterized protein n=2 Tax=Entomophthora muscae TaxID=34485 RepID=A0ACC2T8D9_9FUNG|nr:hypothetical protein DSO57_1015954 [Entomophthora muscae]KAJ9070865.1 hypothetical protein DSO57_1002925 [Entomophthora muscae]